MIKTSIILHVNVVFWVASNLMCFIAWYPHTMAGFLSCYWLSIPFFFTAFLKTWALIRAIEIMAQWLTEGTITYREVLS